MNSYISVPILKFLSAELKGPSQFLVGLIAAMEAVTIVVSRPWTIYFHIAKRHQFRSNFPGGIHQEANTARDMCRSEGRAEVTVVVIDDGGGVYIEP